MSMGTGGGLRAAGAEINVTPLIDVLLVLLIIFMVIVPSVPKGLEALVPQPPRQPQADSSPQSIVVEISSGKDGEPIYKINEQSFARIAVLPALRDIFAARAHRTMFVKGDPDLLYSTIAEVIDFGHQAGVDNVGIITTGLARR